MGFDGLRVLSLESRRSPEMATLIRNQGGVPITAPSMREIPLEQNPQALAFGERLFAGGFDLMIFLTGVGARALDNVLATRYPPEQFREALRKLPVVVRGPKPSGVCREWKVPVAAVAPEPNTWRELLAVMDGRPERRIAVQEYGRSNVELLHGLRARGHEVTPVPVYQWALPEDTGPLREAVHRLAAGECDVVLLTTGNQVPHLFEIASQEDLEQQVRAALARMVVASIGPSTSEVLADHGLAADIVPSHPKMGFLVKETADQAAAILRRKRGPA